MSELNELSQMSEMEMLNFVYSNCNTLNDVIYDTGVMYVYDDSKCIWLILVDKFINSYMNKMIQSYLFSLFNTLNDNSTLFIKLKKTVMSFNYVDQLVKGVICKMATDCKKYSTIINKINALNYIPILNNKVVCLKSGKMEGQKAILCLALPSSLKCPEQDRKMRALKLLQLQ